MMQSLFSFGPLCLAFGFAITVAVFAFAFWQIFKKQSPVFWKASDYAYLGLTVAGGIVAVTNLWLSNSSKELEQNRMMRYDKSINMRDYVAVGIEGCKRLKADKEAASIDRNDYIQGVIKPPADIKPLTPFKKGDDYRSLKIRPPEFNDLSEAYCTFLRQVSDAVASNNLGVMALEARSRQGDRRVSKWFKDDSMEIIASDIQDINEYSERVGELEESISSSTPYSVPEIWSAILLAFGIGIRLARTQFEVNKEREEQRRKAAASLPSPTIAPTNDEGLANIKPTPIDAPTSSETQD